MYYFCILVNVDGILHNKKVSMELHNVSYYCIYKYTDVNNSEKDMGL